MSNFSNQGATDELVIDPNFQIVDETKEVFAPEMDETNQTQPPIFWALVRELVETIVLSLILFFIIRQVVQNYRIESHSMEPNFKEGQFVLVNKLAYRIGEVHRGEVLVFHNPDNKEEDFIKRIIGLPGDTVELKDDKVYVNGLLLPEPFDHHVMNAGYTVPPTVVSPNELFVMGDNRPNSKDSRMIGTIGEELVVGKAWLRVWPFEKFGFIEHYDLQPGT